MRRARKRRCQRRVIGTDVGAWTYEGRKDGPDEEHGGVEMGHVPRRWRRRRER